MIEKSTNLKKDAELGTYLAGVILSHIKNDGYDIDDVKLLNEQLNDDLNGYLFALFSYYGYVLPQDTFESKKIFYDKLIGIK